MWNLAEVLQGFYCSAFANLELLFVNLHGNGSLQERRQRQGGQREPPSRGAVAFCQSGIGALSPSQVVADAPPSLGSPGVGRDGISLWIGLHSSTLKLFEVKA